MAQKSRTNLCIVKMNLASEKLQDAQLVLLQAQAKAQVNADNTPELKEMYDKLVKQLDEFRQYIGC
jgi:hypothetical protein